MICVDPLDFRGAADDDDVDLLDFLECGEANCDASVVRVARHPR